MNESELWFDIGSILFSQSSMCQERPPLMMMMMVMVVMVLFVSVFDIFSGILTALGNLFSQTLEARKKASSDAICGTAVARYAVYG